MKEVPFGEEGEGAAPPTPVGPKSRSVYITLDRVIKFSETLDARHVSERLVTTHLSAANDSLAVWKRRKQTF